MIKLSSRGSTSEAVTKRQPRKLKRKSRIVLETKIRLFYVPIEQLQKNSEIQTSDLTGLSIMALIIRYLVSRKARDGQNEMIQVDMHSVDTHFILRV